MKVLFLTEWYPHQDDSMYGLFVRKHALALARTNTDVCVLYLHPRERQQIIETRVRHDETEQFREIIVYYNPKKHSYLRALREGYHEVSQWGMPDICQVNVISKDALLATYLRLFHHVPYIVVEHWSGYLPETGMFQRLPWWKKQMFRYVARHAKAIGTVSPILENSMQQCGLRQKHYQRVNNVVDDFFYLTQLNTRESTPHNLLHVSCFDEQAKNVCGILDAIKMLSLKRQDFVLNIVGTGKDIALVRQHQQDIDLDSRFVNWIGEQTPQEVAEWFKRSDLFVLFSNYETAGVVIAESLATGTPIVSTPVGIAINEVTPDVGLLTTIGDTIQLARDINYILDNIDSYDTERIFSHAREYSERAVGEKLLSLLQNIL